MTLLPLDEPVDQRVVVWQQVLVHLRLNACLIQLKGQVRLVQVCFDTHHTSPRCGSDVFGGVPDFLYVTVEDEFDLTAGLDALHIEVFRFDSFLFCRADRPHGVLLQLDDDLVPYANWLNFWSGIRVLLLASKDTTTSALASFIQCPDSFDILIALVSLHRFVPSQKADAEVHLSQEWVHQIASGSDFAQEPLESFLSTHFLLCHAYAEQLVLGDKFANLHRFVQVEPPVVVAQDPVQQLVEVDEAILRLYTHLQHLLFQLWVSQVSVAKRRRDRFQQLWHLACIELLTALMLRELDPRLDDDLIVSIEEEQRARLVEIQLLELLNDDQNEQIEHHVGHQQNEHDEVDGSELASAGQTRLAVWQRPAAVVHDHVPILARGDGEQKKEATIENCEILVLVYHIPFLDLAEHELTQDGQDEEEEHQQHENIEKARE